MRKLSYPVWLIKKMMEYDGNFHTEIAVLNSTMKLTHAEKSQLHNGYLPAIGPLFGLNCFGRAVTKYNDSIIQKHGKHSTCISMLC